LSHEHSDNKEDKRNRRYFVVYCLVLRNPFIFSFAIFASQTNPVSSLIHPKQTLHQA